MPISYRMSTFLAAPLDGVINYNLTRNFNKYVAPNLTENLGIVKDKNDKEFDVHYYEDAKQIVIMAVEKNENRAAAGLTLQRIDKNCNNVAFEITFGGVSSDYRGSGLAEKLSIFLSEDHVRWMTQEGRTDKVYLSTGATVSYALMYLGKKQFDLNLYDVWVCNNVDEISDDTKILYMTDEEVKIISKKLRTGSRIYVANK